MSAGSSLLVSQDEEEAPATNDPGLGGHSPLRTGSGYKITRDACAKVGLELFDIGTDFLPGQVLRVVAVMAYAYLLWLDYCPIPDWQVTLALVTTGFMVVLHGLVVLAATLLNRLDEEEEPISTPEQLLQRQTIAPGTRGQRGLVGFLAMLVLLFLLVLAAINEGVKRPAPANPYIMVEGLPSYLAAYSGQYEHRGYCQPQYIQRGSAGNWPAFILQHRRDLENNSDRWVLNGAEAGTPHPCPAGSIGKDGAGVDRFASDSVTPAGQCLAFAPVTNLRAGVEDASLQWWVRSTTTTTTTTSRTSTATTRTTKTRTRITTPTPSFSLQWTSADAEDWVWALALTGHFLAAGGMDRTVRIYSLPDFRLHRALRDAEGSVEALALTGDFLAAGGEDRKGKVRVYSV